MRKTQNTTRSATIAIAAMLALGPTSVLAQTAPETGSETASSSTEPIVILPETMTQSAPAPAQTTSTPTAAPIMSSPVAPSGNNVSSPVVQAVPVTPAEPADEAASTDAAEETVATPTAVTNTAAAPARSSTRSTRSTSAAPIVATTSASPIAEAVADAGPLASENDFAATAVAPVAATAASPVAPTDSGAAFDWQVFAALALMGLIPIGMIALAMLWWRRRSRRAEIFVRDPDATRERYAAPATEPVTESVPEGATPKVTPLATAAAATRKPVRPAASSGQVVLPRKLPATYEERSELLRRMVAAKPDRANPFRSPKRRAKRARLILQSLERKFENAKPAIDLSQYSYIWPNLADSGSRKVA